MNLTKGQLIRYSYNILLKEIKKKGQKKLLNSKVLVVGSGGLGSVVIFYLSATGVGTIGVVDSDKVELSNLQRQIIHTTEDIGKEKVFSVKEKIKKLNPDIKIVPYSVRLGLDNIKDIVKNYDIVADCSDNFSTRFLVNSCCVSLNKPLSHGAILRFDGELMTIIPKVTACYRCVFENLSVEDIPSTRELGVFGASCGVIGSLQVLEIVKYLLDIGDLLTNKLLIFSGLESEVKIFPVKRKRTCPVCGVPS